MVRAQPWYQRVRPGALYFVGLVPGIWTFTLGVMDRLGPDPIKALEHDLGLWALKFLVIGLAITPLRRLTGISLLRYRRALGLLAFFYVCLHLLTYLVLDQNLALEAIWADILKRPYITIGMAAFLVLLPLAVTSNNMMVRRLGGPAWQKLHRWVYLAVVLAVTHFVMVAKVWEPDSLVYAGLVLALLGYRVAMRFATDGGRARSRRQASVPQRVVSPIHQ